MGRARKRKQDRDGAPNPAAEAAPKAPRTAAGSLASAVALAGVLLLAVATYANSFSIPFLFDDHFAIVGNPEVQSLEPYGRFFTQSRGIPHLLDTLNYHWGGESVWGYHFVNLVVHLVNGLLVYGLTLLTLRLPIHGGRYDRRAPVMAALVTAIFLVHPLQTMAVSYIVQRAESVAAMFYLVAVLLFAAGRSGRLAVGGVPLAALLVLIGLLGIVSKETVASLPIALLLYHLCFLRCGREDGGGMGRILVLSALPVLYGIFLARHFLLPGFGDDAGQSSWMYIPTAGMDVEGVTPWRYLITQFGVIVWYLRLWVLPNQLTFDYGWPFADSLFSASVLLPLAVLLMLVAVAIVAYPRYRWATFAIGWLFVTLAPSSSIIPIKDAAFEYRMYLPMLGLIMLAVVGASDVIRTWATSESTARSRERAAVGFAMIVIVALAMTTVTRNQTLADPLALAIDSAGKAPRHWRNQFGLGAALLEAGKSREAVAPFERAIELNPEQATARIMLGDLYSRAGRMEEAEDVLLPATDAREESVSAAAYRQLGYIYKGQGYSDAAITMFEEALVRKPKWRSLDIQIVRLLRHEGRFHDAAVRLNRLVRDEPTYADRLGREVYQINLLGGVHSFEEGEPDFALHMLAIATGDPKILPTATHYLAYVYAEIGNPSEAIRLLKDLERRGLADPTAAANLARVEAGERMVVPVTSAALARRR